MAVSGKGKARRSPGPAAALHQFASEIGRDMEDTAEKLKELTKCTNCHCVANCCSGQD